MLVNICKLKNYGNFKNSGYNVFCQVMVLQS